MRRTTVLVNPQETADAWDKSEHAWMRSNQRCQLSNFMWRYHGPTHSTHILRHVLRVLYLSISGCGTKLNKSNVLCRELKPTEGARTPFSSRGNTEQDICVCPIHRCVKYIWNRTCIDTWGTSVQRSIYNTGEVWYMLWV